MSMVTTPATNAVVSAAKRKAAQLSIDMVKGGVRVIIKTFGSKITKETISNMMQDVKNNLNIITNEDNGDGTSRVVLTYKNVPVVIVTGPKKIAEVIALKRNVVWEALTAVIVIAVYGVTQKMPPERAKELARRIFESLNFKYEVKGTKVFIHVDSLPDVEWLMKTVKSISEELVPDSDKEEKQLQDNVSIS